MGKGSNWLKLFVMALATWRITSMFVFEKGPSDMFAKIRDKAEVYAIGPDGWPVSGWGKLLSCPWCLSVWVGGGVVLVALSPIWPVVLTPFALSAIAVIIHEKVVKFDG